MSYVKWLPIVIAMGGTAQAQQAATPPFVPYTINQETHTRIMNYLGEQPAKIAIPLMQTLGDIQQQAIREKIKQDAAKALEDGKKPIEERQPPKE